MAYIIGSSVPAERSPSARGAEVTKGHMGAVRRPPAPRVPWPVSPAEASDLTKAEQYERQASRAHPRSEIAAFYKGAAKELRARWERQPDDTVTGGWFHAPSGSPALGRGEREALLAKAAECERVADGLSSPRLAADHRALASELRRRAEDR